MKKSVLLSGLTFWLVAGLFITPLALASSSAPAQPATSQVTPSVSVSPTVTPTIAVFPSLPPDLRVISKTPTLSAKAAIAIDADTGRILFAKNSHQALPMASTTKIMTALTLFSLSDLSLDDKTTIVKDDLVGEANMGLVVNQRISLIYLLYGMLMDSANDAAVALARYGGSKIPGEGDALNKFMLEMNTLALKLGMKDSVYKNPHGLDEPGHVASAYDLALAGWHALRNPKIAEIVKQSEANVNGNKFFNISNFIRRYPGATGVKPGETDEAGLCLVASASRFGHNAIVVLMGDPNLRTESDLLMDYAFNQIITQPASQEYMTQISQPIVPTPTAAVTTVALTTAAPATTPPPTPTVPAPTPVPLAPQQAAEYFSSQLTWCLRFMMDTMRAAGASG